MFDLEPGYRKFSPEEITSIADRLEIIVQVALKSLNQSLSSGIPPEENKKLYLNAENNSNSNGGIKQSFYPFSIRITRKHNWQNPSWSKSSVIDIRPLA